ncbi:type II toxin-antitoxin system RelE/ParE family toxin [Patescibacteria group bacterium]|nr:type II toxin-antitoxin system RelE/ParE family toxin [Patescibacteria group bacterium]MBU1472598.1 type II toxin-antitoxin system RelE/ParE family toxin [Patescibacteria group bacterium]MBU2459850.1 type II toxin-antitoxin system RelE/ParE family toxin [Patescibacteria group bacterium]MBU2544089.1 type II toxin-antitoxin system RelE/ParE family toxin [Patescibacteria group bacterium]
MRIDYSRPFLKQLRKTPVEVRKVFQSRLDLFVSNPHHPLLRNHKLTGKYQGCRSINITGDWRAIYEERDELFEPYILFLTLGTHNQLYR